MQKRLFVRLSNVFLVNAIVLGQAISATPSIPLQLDVDTPPLDQPLPSDLNHIHFGNGQTEKKITLAPGPHTLQLILADDRHMPHDPPVISERIKVFVKTVRKRSRRR